MPLLAALMIGDRLLHCPILGQTSSAMARPSDARKEPTQQSPQANVGDAAGVDTSNTTGFNDMVSPSNDPLFPMEISSTEEGLQ